MEIITSASLMQNTRLEKMIDLHCHLLPGIDDGASSLEESLALARIAVNNHITHAILTPHIHPGRYTNTRSSIQDVFNRFKAEIDKQKINLRLGFAAEVRLCPEIISMVEENQIPFYGDYQGQQIMLLELPPNQIPLGCEKLIQWLLDRNIRPMIAHPERNKAINNHFDKILPFVEMGCLFQITASSVAGLFGSRAEKSSIKFLEKEWVTVIASDAHHQEHRPPRLDHGRAAAAKIIGEVSAQQLVYDNPLAIAASQFQNF